MAGTLDGDAALDDRHAGDDLLGGQAVRGADRAHRGRPRAPSASTSRSPTCGRRTPPTARAPRRSGTSSPTRPGCPPSRRRPRRSPTTTATLWSSCWPMRRRSTSPGTACAEHALTYGHLCDQLVRLATGEELADRFARIAARHGWDLHLRVARADLGRVADLVAVEPDWPAPLHRRPALGAGHDPARRAARPRRSSAPSGGGPRRSPPSACTRARVGSRPSTASSWTRTARSRSSSDRTCTARTSPPRSPATTCCSTARSPGPSASSATRPTSAWAAPVAAARGSPSPGGTPRRTSPAGSAPTTASDAVYELLEDGTPLTGHSRP